MRKRARNLTDSDIAKVVALLDGWAGALTWDALLGKVEARLGCRYTRQALHKHTRIQQAFSACRQCSESERSRGPTESQMLRDRIARLEAENQRLRRENNSLLEQFARWAYNASTRDLGLELLNRPLPPIQR